MKSKIQFNVGYPNGGSEMEPVISISCIESDDTRDHIAKCFRQGLGYNHNLLFWESVGTQDKYGHEEHNFTVCAFNPESNPIIIDVGSISEERREKFSIKLQELITEYSASILPASVGQQENLFGN